MPNGPTTFEEFWPYYLNEHRHPTNRKLHMVGTSTALAAVAGAVVKRDPTLLAVAAVAGYGPAWIGHFFFEKNRPATFKYPLWSLRADLQVWAFTVGRAVGYGPWSADRRRSARASSRPR